MELLDDEIENNSETPTEVSGEAKVQFQILPIRLEPTGWFTFAPFGKGIFRMEAKVAKSVQEKVIFLFDLEFFSISNRKS